MNLYAFVNNQPVIRWDPTGLAPFKNNCDEPIPFKPETNLPCGVKEDKKYDCPQGKICNVDGIYPPGEKPVKICDGCQVSCESKRTPKWLMTCTPLGWVCMALRNGGPLPDDWWGSGPGGKPKHPDWPRPEDPSLPLPPDYNSFPNK